MKLLSCRQIRGPKSSLLEIQKPRRLRQLLSSQHPITVKPSSHRCCPVRFLLAQPLPLFPIARRQSHRCRRLSPIRELPSPPASSSVTSPSFFPVTTATLLLLFFDAAIDLPSPRALSVLCRQSQPCLTGDPSLKSGAAALAPSPSSHRSLYVFAEKEEKADERPEIKRDELRRRRRNEMKS